jgi:hypothetical protein
VSAENYTRILKAFETFKMPVFDMTEENFLQNCEMTVFSFGRPPVSIEIIKTISGISFEEVYSNAIDTEIEGIPLKVISLSNLKTNKRASGRAKDINDLENLPD